MLSEASDEAQRVREEAEIEASRRRSDAAPMPKPSCRWPSSRAARWSTRRGRIRERVLSELARRRELAREQIEQLLHGRDRLMQSFERARIVAVDVVAELKPLGEPDEYVNLSPTTGPVPVMLPNTGSVRTSTIAADAAADEAGDGDESTAIDVEPQTRSKPTSRAGRRDRPPTSEIDGDVEPADTVDVESSDADDVEPQRTSSPSTPSSRSTSRRPIAEEAEIERRGRRRPGRRRRPDEVEGWTR